MASLLNAQTVRPLWRAAQHTRLLSTIPSTKSALKPADQKKPSPKIMFFVNKHNSLSQRIAQELSEIRHNIEVCEIEESQEMVSLAKQKKPDIIMCPFLTKRVPEEVWSDDKVPCLIIHPGIEGDRGMTSIDWALKEQIGTWGVTVLQAHEEMDAGDIWSTRNFSINRPNINTLTKSSLYANEVTEAAVESGLEAIQNYINGIEPRPLDYSKPHVQGRLRRNMKTVDRIVDWELPAEDVANIVRMSDSSPGAVAQIRLNRGGEWSEKMRVFGAYQEQSGLQELKGVPGEVLGQRNNGILVKCGRGAVWLSHIKKNKLKLPSMFWLRHLPVQDLSSPSIEIPHGTFPETFQEIWTSVTPDGICYVNFDFYNGAMSTTQCERLESALARIENDDRVKVIVLKGGYNFFSNGIHLNVIESAQDPSFESWRNINAINDVVKRIFSSKKVTISAVQGNAGAGGAMMTLASDLSFSRDGVVFNPHYRTMHLYGSEYHTYFLPRRVGDQKARELLDMAAPMLSTEAVRVGFLDGSSGSTHQEFDEYIEEIAKSIASPSVSKVIQRSKKQNRDGNWSQELEKHRREELAVMADNFQSDDYHRARKSFVYH